MTAREPRTGPDVVEGLTRDPDPEVRAALARHPNPPARRLTELLVDPELAHAVAANPALDQRTADRLVRTHDHSPW
ncbi:hypothetical protein [Streptomyces echinatus]|uniref:hypothetical protein n=1 Tax=Streptomyces echinatus TaxID=67293 RepID=UPI00378B5182